jgi:hypothetical protein
MKAVFDLIITVGIATDEQLPKNQQNKTTLGHTYLITQWVFISTKDRI